jgi:hypothetical protein
MVPLTLGDYVKRIGSSFGALAVLGAALPLASFLPGDWSAFLFPPLGDLTPAARIASIAVVLIFICFGYIGIGSTGLKKWIAVATTLALMTACAYIYYSLQYILKISVPGGFYLVSIGSEKTDFANKTFVKGESAWEMVESRGLDDEQIMKIWTPQSVRSNRLKLFLTYLATALCWALIFSLATALEINYGAKPPISP